MIIVDTSSLNDKERINLPESLFVYSNDGFLIYNTDTMVIVTNTRDYKNIATANEGTVKAGEPILVVEA